MIWEKDRGQDYWGGTGFLSGGRSLMGGVGVMRARRVFVELYFR